MFVYAYSISNNSLFGREMELSMLFQIVTNFASHVINGASLLLIWMKSTLKNVERCPAGILTDLVEFYSNVNL
jgi:hypothetical protein